MHMTVLRDEQRRHYCAIVAPVRYTARGGGGGGTPLKEANGDVPLDGVAFRMGSKIFGFWGE